MLFVHLTVTIVAVVISIFFIFRTELLAASIILLMCFTMHIRVF